MKSILLLILSFFFFCRCNAGIDSQNKGFSKLAVVNGNYRLTISKNADTVKLNKPGFIFFYPSDKAIDSLKKAMGEGGFETIVEDNTFYNGQAIDILREKHLYYNTNANSDDILIFIKKDSSVIKINLNNQKKKWGIYLFNGKDAPVLTSPDHIEQDIKKYF